MDDFWDGYEPAPGDPDIMVGVRSRMCDGQISGYRSDVIVVDDLAMVCYDGATEAPIHEDVFIAEVIRRGIESTKLQGYENLVNPVGRKRDA
jgi:hypothetical protein